MLRAVHMKYLSKNSLRVSLMLCAAMTLSACDKGFDFGTVGDMLGGNRPADDAAILPRPDPDPRGVITYSTYQVMVARQGDTVASMANRVNLSTAELAAHNGLPETYAPRPGEVIAIPRNVGGSIQDNVWSPEIAVSALDNATISSSEIGSGPISGPADNPFNNGQSGSVVEPIRHRVRAGETAFSVARLYKVSVTSLAEWNGLNSEMALRENQELLIPVVSTASAQAQPIPETEVAINTPGTNSELPPPPSAGTPLPKNQDINEVKNPPSPDLSQTKTPPGARGKLLKPVASGTILRPYATSGPRKNEGIDFAAPAGTEVRAAEGGEVALISESLGGLGTIVLIRHPDNLMTVYGRVSGVTLKKGDKVNRGQKVGVVAKGAKPNLHFEIRRGTASVDPAPYL